jgi:CrcB protein
MANWLWVALGGALGASARYGASTLLNRVAGASFPLGTLAVNAVGCALAGAALGWLEREPSPAHVRLFLIVGVLGGFTTFSAFGVETLALHRDGRSVAALGNVALNVVLGLFATFVGWQLAAR